MLLPVWMTNPEAGRFKVEGQARLSLSALIELQKLIKDYHQASAQSHTKSIGAFDEKHQEKRGETAGPVSQPSNSAHPPTASKRKGKSHRSDQTIDD